MVVILAVGTADQSGTAAGNGFDLIAAGPDVLHDLRGGQAVVMVVVGGMAHDLMARIVKGLHRFRIFVHPVAHHEKGGLDVVLRQNVNEMLGILVTPR